MPTIYLAYGSESGNAQRLALALAKQLTQNGFVPKRCVELNAISLSELNYSDTVLIVASSFGDGEPAGNASDFYEQLLSQPSLDCQFAVFGLGDVSYPKFCGFSIEIDALMRERGAQAIAERVDADTNYHAFFAQWSQAVCSYFSGQTELLQSLHLQVKAYSENHSFPAAIESSQRIDSGEFPAYDIQLNIAGSGMRYQAGDLLYVNAPGNAKTLARIAEFYGGLNEVQQAELRTKEVRRLSKPLLRSLAKLTGDNELKSLTKMRASQQLVEYCYGRDVGDVLHEFCSPEQVSFDELLTTLSPQIPRAYSIASCGTVEPDIVRLCVREVAYQLNGNDYVGSASHFLAHHTTDAAINVFVRDNPHFHLPENDRVPIIMIAAGVGIAPFMGFLASTRAGEMHLFFGERHHQQDFLYYDELQAHLLTGRLNALHTAFSRDQAEKIYVQDVLRDNGDCVWALLQNRAEVYVCGSKANLGKNIDNALCDIAHCHGELSEADAQQWLIDLTSEGRYHQDVY